MRCDFNVPLADGHISDDFRIRAALPTLKWLTERGASVTTCTHLGRPKGKPDPRFDVSPVRARLAEIAPGVALLDNLRFSPGEEANDPSFVDRLVAGQDMYVDDAFGCAHRAHASVVGPPARLPSAAGRLLAREVAVLSGLLDAPARPFVAVLGGAKVSDKLGLVSALLEKVDEILIGGGMCFTFLAAAGHSIGDSVVEADQIGRCRELLQSGRIVLPSDLVVGCAAAPDMWGHRRGGHHSGLEGSRYRTLHLSGFRPGHQRGGHRPVEWPDGDVRGSSFCRRNECRRRGRRRVAGLFGRRRRRHGSSSSPVPANCSDRPPVDRRRRNAGVHREG